MKKKIYIAGKVTGLYPEDIKLKFEKAQHHLESLGYEVVNPINVVNNTNAEWTCAMRTCIKALIDCDALVLLSDWFTSNGAKIEKQLAEDLNMIVVNNDSVGLLLLKIKLMP